jgi:predicted dehydrogenase
MISSRRSFLKSSAVTTASMVLATPLVKTSRAKSSPNNTINVAVIGLHGRGKSHYRSFCRLPNVKVTTLCDIDERLFANAVQEIEKLTGNKPKTVVDYHQVLEDKDIDVVSLATPDHWHGLQTIWACQAGKDVYVEKPLAYTIEEGRKMVQAGRKYKCVVQIGTQHTSDPVIREAINQVRDGVLGKVYMGRVIVYGHRSDIGRVKDSAVPPGVNWDLFLGPAPYRPFNENRFHYKWHWYWDTSTSEFGNNGVHFLDIIRRGMDKRIHPVKVNCSGGFYAYDSDQEIPNLQVAHYEYADGAMIELEVRSLYTNPEAGLKSGCFFYGSKGWMQIQPGAFKTFLGDKDEPGPGMTRQDQDTADFETKGLDHFHNFIDCVRSRKCEELHADVLEGHLSTTLSHLGNISYRTGRKLDFNPYSEKFINDDDANSFLQREYRQPFVLPEQI